MNFSYDGHDTKKRLHCIVYGGSEILQPDSSGGLMRTGNIPGGFDNQYEGLILDYHFERGLYSEQDTIDTYAKVLLSNGQIAYFFFGDFTYWDMSEY